ncbi:piggyBac transposable element-derived protein 5-like [Saccostrea cucullata]|uniref:piggyBac transposable element-derived protein 5-like n=1 Tax=Saccostrea cuccullata TaxID=36930 RepID=UPI002ED262FA
MGFTGVPGLNVEMPDDQHSPLDFFNLFIKDDDFQTMADETNRYAEQYLQRNEGNLKPSSRFRNWVKTTLDEMKVFIAMTIAMGLVVQLDISEYWTISEVNTTPFFPSLMPRDRFWLLMCFFHLADNSAQVR